VLDSIVVVGGGAAGVTAAETLRHEGFGGRIALVCEESTPPYDRPPLSKQILTGAWETDRLRLRELQHYRDLNIELHYGRAERLDPEQRRVHLRDNSHLDYDGLIIATGVRPRPLPQHEHRNGMHMLRGIPDVDALRATLHSGRRLVVIGAGLLGMEAAGSATTLGLDVAVVDPLPQPMIRQVGPTIGAAIADLHRERGVRLHTGVGVRELYDDGSHITGVGLADGSDLPADTVLVSIGAIPAVDWLSDSGLPIGDGVECDEYCRVTESIYAAGDVASWVNPRYGRRMRLEHRMNATEQGAAAAVNLLKGNAEPFSPLPYFWSDQYNVKIQVHGWITPESEFSIAEGSQAEGKFVGLYHHLGRLTAVLGWNSPAKLLRYRKQLLEDSSIGLSH
jgi:3-phenylpropionate/trans-cinnamate dioxygenase ferredoxin reductase component